MYEELEVPGQYGNLRFMCLVDVYRKHFTYSPTELPIKDAVVVLMGIEQVSRYGETVQHHYQRSS